MEQVTTQVETLPLAEATYPSEQFDLPDGAGQDVLASTVPDSLIKAKDNLETAEDWDRPLTDLVRENAHVLVKPSWMDVELPLGAAMHHVTITRENVHSLVAEVHHLLANRVVETEEPSGEESSKEESVEAEKLKEEVIDKAETSEEGDANVATQQAEEKSGKIESKSQAKNESTVTTPQASFTPAEAQVEGDPNHSSPVETVATSKGAGASEVPPTKVSASESSGVQTVIQSSSEPAIKAASVKEEFSKITRHIKPEIAPKVVEEIKSIRPAEVLSSAIGIRLSDEQPHPLDEEAEQLTSVVELDEQLETAAALSLEAESEPQFDISELASPSDNNLIEREVSPDENELPVIADDAIGESIAEHLDFEMSSTASVEATEPLEFAETTIRQAVEATIIELSEGESISLQAEINLQERSPQISVPIEEIEDSFVQLSELIQSSEPETVEVVKELLDKIIEVPVRFNSEQDTITEDEAQTELEELFTQLFERMNIDYTPELVESLAFVVLKYNLVAEIEKLKDEAEADQKPQDSGTHEIIKKLLAGLSFIKKAIARAGVIGKSALRLYSVSFAA